MSWPVQPQWQQALAADIVQWTVYADIYENYLAPLPMNTQPIPIISGSVTMDSTTAVRRQASGVTMVSVPGLNLLPTQSGDLLFPDGTEMLIYKGIVYSGGRYEPNGAPYTPDISGNGFNGYLEGAQPPVLEASPWPGFDNAFKFNGTSGSGINCGAVTQPSGTLGTPDASGNGFTGTIEGASPPTLVSSPWSGFGSAVSFNGSTGSGIKCVSVPQITEAPWTIECKVIPTSSIGISIIGWQSSDGLRFLYLFLDTIGPNSYFGLAASGFSIDLFSPVVFTGTSYDLAADCDGTNVWLYLDGVMVATVAVTGSGTLLPGDNFWVGNSDSDNAFIGTIDEVRVSNVARYGGVNYTPAIVPFTPAPGAVALYHLDTFSTSGPWTLECKVKIGSNTTTNVIVGWYSTDNTRFFALMAYPQYGGGPCYIYFNADPMGVSISSTPILLEVGSTHDLAVSSDGTTVWLYIDGVVARSSEGILSEAGLLGGDNFWIGNADYFVANNIPDFVGIVDEVRWSDVDRYGGIDYTPATEPFSTGIAYPGTVGLWPLDEIIQAEQWVPPNFDFVPLGRLLMENVVVDDTGQNLTFTADGYDRMETLARNEFSEAGGAYSNSTLLVDIGPTDDPIDLTIPLTGGGVNTPDFVVTIGFPPGDEEQVLVGLNAPFGSFPALYSLTRGYNGTTASSWPAGTPVTVTADTVIASLLQQQLNDVPMNITPSSFVLGNVTYAVGDDPSALITEMAASANMEAFFNQVGVFQLLPIPAAPYQPTAAYFAEGPNCTMTELQRTFSNSGVPNWIILISQGTNVPTPLRSDWQDMNSASPTFFDGGYPTTVQVVTTSLNTTQAQNDAMVITLGTANLGQFDQLVVTYLGDPSLDVYDNMAVSRFASGLAYNSYSIIKGEIQLKQGDLSTLTGYAVYPPS